MSLQNLKAQKSSGGYTYTCASCKGLYASGRYLLRTPVSVKQVCPSCWSEMLARLEELTDMMREMQ